VTNKPTGAAQAAGATPTQISGAGPVIAATVTGEAADVSRFAGQDGCAACNATAPVAVPPGKRTGHRRGNRKVNHAARMAAVTQARRGHSGGRACHAKKLAAGKTANEALRALKRQLSDVYCKHPKAGAARSARGPGGQAGNVCRQRGRLTPRTPARRPGRSRTPSHPTTSAPAREKQHVTGTQKNHRKPLTQRGIDPRGRTCAASRRTAIADQADLRA